MQDLSCLIRETVAIAYIGIARGSLVWCLPGEDDGTINKLALSRYELIRTGAREGRGMVCFREQPAC